MILDAADHRTIAVHAIRLGQVAAADRDRDGLADTLTHHQALHTALDAPVLGEANVTPGTGVALTAEYPQPVVGDDPVRDERSASRSTTGQCVAIRHVPPTTRLVRRAFATAPIPDRSSG
jgi:hypothetical protein